MLAVANTGSYVGPQYKIGHPVGCRFQCWVPAEYHHHLSRNREGRWGTTDDFATSEIASKTNKQTNKQTNMTCGQMTCEMNNFEIV